MSNRSKKIAQAWLHTPSLGVVELVSDWYARYLPPISLGADGPVFKDFSRLHEAIFARYSGYYVSEREEICFCVWLDQYPWLPDSEAGLYLAGDFNGWQDAIGKAEWRLMPGTINGEDVLMWTGKASTFAGYAQTRFKFVTGDHKWLDVPTEAPNAVRDEGGATNRYVDMNRTGQHLFQFTLEEPVDPARDISVYWQNEDKVTLRPGDYFFQLESDVMLGAMVMRDGNTRFRIFAPRATVVELCVCSDLAEQASPYRYQLDRREDYVWEVTLEKNLHGWYYWYHIDGPRNEYTRFDPSQPILDPYALATVDRMGPGIVLDHTQIAKPESTQFKTPAWQDLIIVEAHVRDLTICAPITLTPQERLGFTGLRKWVESPDFYLHELGVNAVELQPIQEFDNRESGEYHWGYMTNNYFSPESSYALDPVHASGVQEFQKLVAAFHRRGIAVILDVVYNHVGEPAHLLLVDQLYYFHTARDGSLVNWSGCGNDLRADAAMARRLIIDSCRHLVETYGVDGFRFDLAELIGVEALVEIEVALKRVKPDIILIAEPWSFRGHIGGALSETGWASWNDGYRNFIRDYVRGSGKQETYEYYLKGSPWHYAKWPAQTVNYAASHDDRCWIDAITENPDNNGSRPTANDRRRTHLMAAVLFMSLGIPMISAGQDILRSKQGVNNTYQRGDLNEINYRRALRFPCTRMYFIDWIAFRRSERGALLRQYTRPRDEFFRFFFAKDSLAAATVYNADCEQGPRRLLFAINPTPIDVTITLDKDLARLKWVQLADQECFYLGEKVQGPAQVELDTFIPAMSCMLWESMG